MIKMSIESLLAQRKQNEEKKKKLQQEERATNIAMNIIFIVIFLVWLGLMSIDFFLTRMIGAIIIACIIFIYFIASE